MEKLQQVIDYVVFQFLIKGYRSVTVCTCAINSSFNSSLKDTFIPSRLSKIGGSFNSSLKDT